MRIITSSILLMLASVTALHAAELSMAINVSPAAIFMDTQADGFTVSSAQTEVEPASIYSLPNVNAGVGIDTDFGYIDLSGGIGILYTDALRSFTVQAEVSLQFQVARSFTIGPHAGIIYFVDPNWTSTLDVELDSAPGFLGGLRATMGDKITYLVSVDLLTSSFDATTGDDITAPSSLDITALGIQFGVRGEF